MVEVLFALFTITTHRVVRTSVAHTAARPTGQLEHGRVVVTARGVIITVAPFTRSKHEEKKKKLKKHYRQLFARTPIARLR